MEMYYSTVTDTAGNIVNGATVTVYLAAGGVASIYDDAGAPMANPFLSGLNRSEGEIEFAAANGLNGAETDWLRDQTLIEIDDLPMIVLVDTLAELRLRAPILEGVRVYLRGGVTSGDGQEGFFRGVAGGGAGTYTDNNGTTITPVGGDGSSAWLREGIVDHISVRWFGAVGDGITDDTVAIQAACDAAAEDLYAFAGVVISNQITVVFPPNRTGSAGYLFTDTVTVPVGVSIDMRDVGLFTPASAKPALVIGDTVNKNFGIEAKIQLRRSSTRVTFDESDVGVLFYNTYWSKLYLKQIREFSVNARCVGYGNGFVYNTIQLENLNGAGVFLDLDSDAGGFCNENLFLKGEFQGGRPDMNPIGVRMTGATTALLDNNTFVSPSIELNATSPYEGEPMVITNGTGIKVTNMRVEDAYGNTNKLARFEGTSANNYIERAAGGSTVYTWDDNSTNKANTVVINQYDYMLYGKALYSSENMAKTWCYYNGSTSVHVPGLHFTNNTAPIVGGTVVTIGSNGLTLPSGYAVGRYVVTSQHKKIVVQADCDGTYSHYIRLYNAAGTILSTASYVSCGNAGPMITFGNMFFTSPLDSACVYTVTDEVKYVGVYVGNGTNIRSIGIYAYPSPDRTNLAAATWAGYDEITPGSNIGTAAPTAGTWGVGRRVINAVPAVGQPKAWICTVAGTPGTWNSEGNL